MALLFTSHIALTIAVVVALGAAAQWIAWRARLPAILPLLVTGFIVGPVLGWITPAELVPAGLLYPAISLAVGLILFEGGLTLRIPEVKEIRGVVFRLVTIGALVTFIGGALAVYVLTDLSPQLSFLFGALIVVTGPTVIGPLLRIVRPEARVANVLKWEGILIDAIGAMVAVMVFEYVLIDNRNEALGQTVLLFLQFILFGTVTGVIGGFALAWLLKRRAVPDYLVNVVALSGVFLVFSIASAMGPESGLLATVLMGVIVGNSGVPNITDLLSFKEDLTILFINLLFIVLAANIQLEAFLGVLNLSGLVLLAVVMLVLRPLNIFVSTWRSPLRLNEKLYLSWIGPRGIVAASVSSLFAARLDRAGFEGAQTLVSLVFLVIVGTVLLNSLTARYFGRLLRVADPDPQGFLILGAHALARKIAAFLREQGVPVLMADTNWSNVAAARAEGLPAYYGSLLSDRSDDELRLGGIGRLLALTSNDEANALTALKYAREFGSQDVYQLEPSREASERNRLGGEQRGRVVFHRGVAYRELARLVEEGGELRKTEVTERFSFEQLARKYGSEVLPMFLLNGKTVKVLVKDGPLPEPGTSVVSLVPGSRSTEVPVAERSAQT
ncbi:MAG: sodium:proton antiporter [Trueperaceae bacterium]